MSNWNQQKASPRRRSPRDFNTLAVVLFIATAISTFLAGGCFLAASLWMWLPLLSEAGRDFVTQRVGWDAFITAGLRYAVPVMLMLSFHEMGHYLQSRRYRVPATPPLFIPMPITPFGTMGAVILQGAGAADRKALFDIAVSGPLAGLIVAIPCCWFGIVHAVVAEVPPGGSVSFGDPLLLQGMVWIVHGPLPEGHDIFLNPLLFAGWVGIFITALNLIPIGQLDGGHILYTLIGRKAHIVAVSLLWGAIAWMVISGHFGYSLIVVLIFLMGAKHPPTKDDSVPLGVTRTIIGWLTLSFIIIGITPIPVSIGDREEREPEKEQREPATNENVVNHATRNWHCPRAMELGGFALSGKDRVEPFVLEAADQQRAHAEILICRVSVGNRYSECACGRRSASADFAVFKDQHVRGFHTQT